MKDSIALCPFCGEIWHQLNDCPTSFTRQRAVETLIKCRRLLNQASKELCLLPNLKNKSLLKEIDEHLHKPSEV